MAICNACGVIMNEKDINKHKCNAADLPAVGTAKKPTTTNISAGTV